MGGYGAMKASLLYPERYGGCICLSGAFDIASFAPNVTLAEWKAIFGYDLEDFESLRTTDHDVYKLAADNKRAGKEFVKTYMWCGDDDFLLDNSVRFHALLSDLGISHKYVQSEGDHSWKWWDLHIRDVLSFFLD